MIASSQGSASVQPFGPVQSSSKKTSSNSGIDSMHPTLRANPFPEVTDLICRLPLPTFFYRLEAIHLGDLMRLWVRPKVRIKISLGFSRANESAPDIPKTECFTSHLPYLQLNWFQGQVCYSLLKRKENSSWDFRWRLRACLCYHIISTFGTGILTCFPFDRTVRYQPY